MRETRRTRKICFSAKIIKNLYIKRRPVMGGLTRERPGGKHFFIDCRFVLFFTADNREKFLSGLRETPNCSGLKEWEG
jgi:hypothetical protein